MIRTLLVASLVALASCQTPVSPGDGGSGGGGGAGGGEGGAGGDDAGSPDAGRTCSSCLASPECGPRSACVQYAGSDYCAPACAPSGCANGETCLVTSTLEGTQVSVCVPSDGTCGASGCGACAAGTECDLVTGGCVVPRDGGTASNPDGGPCGSLEPPAMASCCQSCSTTTLGCQSNGCFAGWWCDRAQCNCRPPPSTCGPGDGGTGAPDAGPPPTGTVGPDGGVVSRLYFAVVGDTRPALPNDTGNYPTAIITRIFERIQALNPRPQFVVATGDYVNAAPIGTAGAAQLALYAQARARFSGTLFPAMGNHECATLSTVNCPQVSSSAVYGAYLDTLVKPIGRTVPYYTVDFTDSAGQWTAKLVVIACNAWDSTQQAWLVAELARPTTYTLVARHHPLGVSGPCTSQSDQALAGANYNLLMVGHTHTYSHSGKQLIEGVGGAPISSSANYGFATVEQLPGGAGFRVTQYDYQAAQPVDSFIVP